MTPRHRSLTARCHEAIDHLGSSGTWNTGATCGEDMPRKPLEGLPSPKNGRMASWHRAVRESFKFQIKAMDKSYFYASNIP
ncbi:hypothetical protein [Arsenophonus nasoniae]|uniref:Uncharacterized protein n=1 Tax=Arsenophonus nasoniae TaxID=638 RepID=A0AA95KEZ4_9GAMM|nr:hypothetical protein [Arsenophonus nasoniae]WGM03354.1 hypothetical protein QE210_17595 [Arsenophonus nasoniae]